MLHREIYQNLIIALKRTAKKGEHYLWNGPIQCGSVLIKIENDKSCRWLIADRRSSIRAISGAKKVTFNYVSVGAMQCSSLSRTYREPLSDLDFASSDRTVFAAGRERTSVYNLSWLNSLDTKCNSYEVLQQKSNYYVPWI